MDGVIQVGARMQFKDTGLGRELGAGEKEELLCSARSDTLPGSER